MFQRSSLVLSFAVVLSAVGLANAQTLTAKNNPPQPQPASATVETDRTRDGLVGPVRRVRTEIVKLANESGKLTEGKRALLEIVSYDIKGNKVENQYFPVQGATLTGKEVYKYDEKGNISEMTLLNDDGTLLSKEVYKYDFDFAGNWNKMTTSVAVVDAGRVIFEPSEVTYRSIMYYLDEKMVKMVQPGASSPSTSESKAVPEPSAKNPKPKTVAKNSAALPAADRVAELHSSDVTAGSTDTTTQLVLNTEPPPPAPSPRMILKPVSGGVLNGSALSLPSPMYPDVARRMNVAGTVSVEVVIDEYGKVISARATSGPASLREAAVNAAQRAKFSPTKLSGQPVKVSGLINYKFTLAT